MDLVGNSTPTVDKLRFELKPVDRLQQHVEYLRATPSVRDVVVSGGDVANMPFKNLEAYVDQLLDIENVRDIRLATKALMGLPQYWYSDDVRAGMERLVDKGTTARSRPSHPHSRQPRKLGYSVGRQGFASHAGCWRSRRPQPGCADGRGQRLRRGLLDLCFALQDGAGILPYYFYMCDMIPFAEHWRLSLGQAQRSSTESWGTSPALRHRAWSVMCRFVGKRWVHQVDEYDTVHGISYWSKNYRTGIELDDPEAVRKTHVYYDPVHELPEEGQQWWIDQGHPKGAVHAASVEAAASSRAAAEAQAADAHADTTPSPVQTREKDAFITRGVPTSTCSAGAD